MQKLWAFLALFQKGRAVADPALWKNASMAVMALGPFFLALSALAHAFDLDLAISESQAGDLATGLVTAVGIVSHLITSKTVGLPAGTPGGAPDEPADRGSIGGA